MKIIELDLTGCESPYDLHVRIRKAFDFPEWYGKNWDAFWDLLWSECDADLVVIRGEHTLPRSFDKPLAILHELLEDNVKEREASRIYGANPFAYKIVD